MIIPADTGTLGNQDLRDQLEESQYEVLLHFFFSDSLRRALRCELMHSAPTQPERVDLSGPLGLRALHMRVQRFWIRESQSIVCDCVRWMLAVEEAQDGPAQADRRELPGQRRFLPTRCWHQSGPDTMCSPTRLR